MSYRLFSQNIPKVIFSGSSVCICKG